MAKVAKFIGLLVFGLAAVVCLGWAVLAIYYSSLPARPFLAAAFPIICMALPFFVKPFKRSLLIDAILFSLLLAWWLNVPASNDRPWLPDHTKLASAEINGNLVTIRNIRNCDYQSETNFITSYYDKTFDLNKLTSADFYTCFWGPKLICHTILTFNFGNEDFVAISIETRKEIGEGFSSIKGFFHQFELIYVVADERDVIRLRTNYRGEDVYLYRLNAPPDQVRNVFLDYLKEVNSLKERPKWYNTLTSNCTSNIRGHTKPYAANSRWSWKLLVNGYVDEMAYSNGSLNKDHSFEELKKRSLISERAKAADKAPDFSKRIRTGLPGFL